MPDLTIPVSDFELQYLERARNAYVAATDPLRHATWDWNLFVVSLAEDILECGPERVEKAFKILREDR